MARELGAIWDKVKEAIGGNSGKDCPEECPLDDARVGFNMTGPDILIGRIPTMHCFYKCPKKGVQRLSIPMPDLTYEKRKSLRSKALRRKECIEKFGATIWVI